MNFFERFCVVGVATGVIVFTLASCSTNNKIPVEERSVESLYDEAFAKLEKSDYNESAKLFDEVERQHPYSVWAAKAQLMAAYAYFQNEKFDDAVMALDRFIQLHPGNSDVPYAYYMRAQCYYFQISDVYRDQEMTIKAKDALAEVFRRFPESVYAKDARFKYDLTVDHLAGKEMAIGRYYLNNEMFLAALNRFQSVVLRYQMTTHVEEALYRMVETYSALGLMRDAVRVAAVLGYNYPDSEWYEMAYDLAKLDEEKLAKIKAEERSLESIEALHTNKNDTAPAMYEDIEITDADENLRVDRAENNELIKPTGHLVSAKDDKVKSEIKAGAETDAKNATKSKQVKKNKPAKDKTKTEAGK